MNLERQRRVLIRGGQVPIKLYSDLKHYDMLDYSQNGTFHFSAIDSVAVQESLDQKESVTAFVTATLAPEAATNFLLMIDGVPLHKIAETLHKPPEYISNQQEASKLILARNIRNYYSSY